MKTFEEKLRSMTARQIIQAMIDGLNREWVMIDMESFGQNKNGVCFGCAATNTLCQINENGFKKNENIELIGDRADFLKCEIRLVLYFESAINHLRWADIKGCNAYLAGLDLPQITNPNNINLEKLQTKNWKKNIHYYQQLADDQE